MYNFFFIANTFSIYLVIVCSASNSISTGNCRCCIAFSFFVTDFNVILDLSGLDCFCNKKFKLYICKFSHCEMNKVLLFLLSTVNRVLSLTTPSLSDKLLNHFSKRQKTQECHPDLEELLLVLSKNVDH